MIVECDVKDFRNPYESPNPIFRCPFWPPESPSNPVSALLIVLLNVTNDFYKGYKCRLVTVLLLILDFSKAFGSIFDDFLCQKLSTI
jgi:hypothetical protein